MACHHAFCLATKHWLNECKTQKGLLASLTKSCLCANALGLHTMASAKKHWARQALGSSDKCIPKFGFCQNCEVCHQSTNPLQELQEPPRSFACAADVLCYACKVLKFERKGLCAVAEKASMSFMNEGVECL